MAPKQHTTNLLNMAPKKDSQSLIL